MKVLKKVTLLMIVAILMVAVSGCGKEKAQKKTHIQFMVGMRSNNKLPDFRLLGNEAKAATKSFGSIGIIVLDGSPNHEEQIDVPEENGMLSENKLDKIAQAQADRIAEFIATTKAQEPEVDILKAFQLAGPALRTVEGDRLIIVSDSGLSTSGLINYSASYLEKIDPVEVVSRLREQSAIPDLNGIHVKWYGLGEVSPPQKELEQKNKLMLKAIWTKILEESGAEVEIMDSPIASSIDVSSFPPVQTVNTIASDNAIVERYTGKEVIKLDEGKIEFYPDQAVIKTDPAQVRAALLPVVEYLIDNPNEQILLIGSTAKPPNVSSTYCIELSQNRCRTIRDVLIENGVSPAQIQYQGLGFNSPYYENDQREDGSLNEMIAARNRAVVILPIDHEVARSVMNN
ncbi:MAG: OmpA family protein [Peptostreptococcaceae bacterium]|nr:OmpA family protein [Peptostreptococcaceae bacterium]